MARQLEVAAAVLRGPDGRVLLGRRAPDTFYPGYWEFPGGKVEPGETPRDALARELAEELGIVVERARPWLTRRHAYEHAQVTLHFFVVDAWHGELRDHVHSALSWEAPAAFGVSPMLPANGPILKSLRLPEVMGVTCASRIGIAPQLAGLDAALAGGLRLVQVREPELSGGDFAAFCRHSVERAHRHGALLIANSEPAQAEACGADGVHLSSRRLARCAARPDLEWVGASCHDRADIDRALGLGVDYLLLGSVCETPSHPDATPLGWARFAELIRALPVPVLAIGGMRRADLDAAQAHGAHGIAMLRGAWPSAA